jgi:23S rRNA (adenine2503-C2)-methyltransferase
MNETTPMNINAKTHLFSLLPEELSTQMQKLGSTLTLAEARRVQAHVIGDGKNDLSLKRPISKASQKILSDNFSSELLTIIERIEDPADKSVRYLFQAQDKSLIEAVRIPLGKPGHFSVCLSSQAGCAMACDFCATGRLGLKRNLEAWEMIAQLWQIKNETEGRISGAVFMGQGEPFHNYENTIRAARLLSAPCGCKINSKNITISTVGLVPQIKRYTEENHPFRLIISLTSAIPEKRARLLPISNSWPLTELAEAIKDHSQKRKERVTLAWVLIKGLNSGTDEVEALKNLLGDTPFKLNLIDVNDARDNGYQRADDAERKAFLHHLQELNVPIVRRYSVGNSSHSACGMLAGKRLSEMKNP